MKKIGFIVLALLFVTSCKKKSDNTPVDFKYYYYPIQTGHYVEYDVLEIKHDSIGVKKHDTSRYQLRIVFGDTILDLENEIAQRYTRYVRDSGNQNWTFKDLWTTKISSNRAELVEENKRKIKLVFRPTYQKEWDMNAFNDLEEQVCYYKDIDIPFDINGFHFDKALVVQEADFKSLIDYQKAYSVYAEGVGLVKKYYKWLEIYEFDTSKINKGTEIYYELINFGEL